MSAAAAVSSGLQASWQDDDGDDGWEEPTEPTVSETTGRNDRGLGFQAACGSRVQLLLDLLKPMNEEHINLNNIINIQHSTATSRRLGV